MDLSNVGISTVKDPTAFKKIQFFSKIDHTSLPSPKSDVNYTSDKINNFYTSNLDLNTAHSYGMSRQHNYTTLNSTLPSFTTLLDSKSLN